MVIWLIGLSGSGKTTVGKEVFRIWKKKSPQTIFLMAMKFVRFLVMKTTVEIIL